MKIEFVKESKLLDEISLERSKNEEISDILAGKLDDQNDEQLNEELEELDAEVKKEQEVTRELSKLKISSYQGFGPEEVALVAGRESPVEEESRADLGPSESKNKEPILST